jgi:trehalose-phosphatase
MNTVSVRETINIAEVGCAAAEEAWDQICTVLAETGHIYLFTDFDGTLADITPVPNAATIDAHCRLALDRLLRHRGVTVAVLSGRSTSDVANRVGLPLTYAGDHGLHIQGADFEHLVPGADAVRLDLPRVCNQLRELTAGIHGVLVEAKRYTASIHYRHVDSASLGRLTAIVRETVDPTRYELRDGQCVIEIRPRLNWDKGRAVQWLLERHGASPRQAVCIGDDETDEDMFRGVPEALNIRVSKPVGRPSAARYCLERKDVPEFLLGVVDVIEALSLSGPALR